MTIEQLRKAYHEEPFRPFTISLADGRRFHVRHPECLSIGPDAKRTFVVVEKDEDYSVIDLMLVSSLDFSETKTNGRRRRV